MNLNIDKPKNFSIVALSSVDERLKAFALISKLVPEIDLDKYRELLEEMETEGNFEMLACALDSKIIGVISYSIITRFYAGKLIQMANLIVDENYRNLGCAKALMDEVERIGRKNKCVKCVLDSYVGNSSAHKVFFRFGFRIEGFHFMKDL